MPEIGQPPFKPLLTAYVVLNAQERNNWNNNNPQNYVSGDSKIEHKLYKPLLSNLLSVGYEELAQSYLLRKLL